MPGHPLDAQPLGLRRPAGHAVVLERTGGVEPLMLENQAVQPGVGGRARRLQQRCIAFPERHHAVEAVEERDDLAVAPHTALVERRVARPALAPKTLQRLRIFRAAGVSALQQAAATRAVVDHISDREARAAALLKAYKFSGHEP
jgi:hypothetical protein